MVVPKSWCDGERVKPFVTVLIFAKFAIKMTDECTGIEREENEHEAHVQQTNKQMNERNI